MSRAITLATLATILVSTTSLTAYAQSERQFRELSGYGCVIRGQGSNRHWVCPPGAPIFSRDQNREFGNPFANAPASLSGFGAPATGGVTGAIGGPGGGPGGTAGLGGFGPGTGS